jgi:hypothetical protein
VITAPATKIAAVANRDGTSAHQNGRQPHHHQAAAAASNQAQSSADPTPAAAALQLVRGPLAHDLIGQQRLGVQALLSNRPARRSFAGSRHRGLAQTSRAIVRLRLRVLYGRLATSRPDKRPLLSELPESGQIEAEADCVLMLYAMTTRTATQNAEEIDIIVRKNSRDASARSRHALVGAYVISRLTAAIRAHTSSSRELLRRISTPASNPRNCGFDLREVTALAPSKPSTTIRRASSVVRSRPRIFERQPSGRRPRAVRLAEPSQ